MPRRRQLCLALWIAPSLLLASCFGSLSNLQYTPDRVYHDLHNADGSLEVIEVEHVHEELEGVYVLSFEDRAVSVRPVFDKHLGKNPNYYASNIRLHTNPHAFLAILVPYLFQIPRVTVDFDVVEVRPVGQEAAQDSGQLPREAGKT